MRAAVLAVVVVVAAAAVAVGCAAQAVTPAEEVAAICALSEQLFWVPFCTNCSVPCTGCGDHVKCDKNASIVSLMVKNQGLQHPTPSIANLTKLTALQLQDVGLMEVPEFIMSMPQLVALDISLNYIFDLPDSFSSLTKLFFLDLGGNNLREIPPQLQTMASLSIVSFCKNSIVNISSDVLGRLTSLTELSITRNHFSVIPESILSLTLLDILDISFNDLTEIPEWFLNLTSLRQLDISDNKLTSVPAKFSKLGNLEVLAMPYNSLKVLPEDFEIGENLTSLDLRGNQLRRLGEWKGSGNFKSLEVSDNQLETLPHTLHLSPKLDTLDLTHNLLLEVPGCIASITSLQALSVSNNKVTAFPDAIGNLNELTWLDASGTKISTLPSSFGNLAALDSLSLAHSSIVTVPEEIGLLTALKTLNLAGNYITYFPSIIGGLEVRQLDLSNNELNPRVPIPICELTEISSLDLSNNKLVTLGAEFASLKTLSYLSLHSNALTSLGSTPWRFTSLTFLDLHWNSLSDVPDWIGNLTSLYTLDLGRNKLTWLPSTINRLTGVSLQIDDNRLPCDKMRRSGEFDDWVLNVCNKDSQNPELPKWMTPVVVFPTLAVFALIVGVSAACYTRRHRRWLRMISSPTHGDLHEFDRTDDTLGIRLATGTLNFGMYTQQLPVDEDVVDSLVITGCNLLKEVPFLIELPEIPEYKAKISVSQTVGKLKRGHECVVQITLRMLCTTTLDTQLFVIVPKKGFMSVKIQVESQLSTKLDADEIKTGAVLGAGSFGTVYRAEWHGIDTAVKVYNESVLADIGLKTDFERELSMVFKLRHPQIVTFYGRTVSPTRVAIVMEFVPFGSFGSLLAKGPLDMLFKVRVALDVARGMNYLHKNRIIHRDLKPDNVLVASLDAGSSVVAKLSDFNTSRFWGRDEMRTKTKGVGTPVFMAPELLEGKHYGPPSDVYSFGMLLWCAWTAKEPFADFASSMELFRFVLEGHRLPIPDGIPGPLCRLTDDAWKPDPAQRPSFADIVQILEPIVSAMVQQ